MAKSKYDKLTSEQEAAVKAWLKENDKRLWLERPSLKKAREELSGVMNINIPPGRFRDLRKETCNHWGAMKFGYVSKARSFNARQWTRLSNAVQGMADDLHGQSLAFCVGLLSSKGVRCNETLLKGVAGYRDLGIKE